MVKSSILLKTAKFILTVFFGAIIFGQEGEIIPLSQKVGLTLDAEENLFYNVYSDIDGFESTQFYEVSIKTVITRITYVQYAQQKTSKRKYTMMEFLRMKEAVDVQPFFTVLHLGLGGRCAPRYCQYSDQYQNSFHYRPYGSHESGARVCLYSPAL